MQSCKTVSKVSLPEPYMIGLSEAEHFADSQTVPGLFTLSGMLTPTCHKNHISLMYYSTPCLSDLGFLCPHPPASLA